MPKFDLTVTASVIIALCAIISPILTAIINNRHQFKILKMEAEQRQFENTIVYRRTIFENYLRFSGKCISHADAEALQAYGEYYLIALMYAPENIKHKMVTTHKLMIEHEWSDASVLYEQLAPMIRDLLQSM